MIFGRRRWALRVTERMGLGARDPATTELVDMLLGGAKTYKATSPWPMPDAELVLMSAAAMSDNRSAYERLSRGRFNAETLLAELRQAGRQLSVEQGYHQLVSHFYDRLPDIGGTALGSKPKPAEALANARQQAVSDCLGSARMMPDALRAGIARDLALTYFQIDQSPPKQRAKKLLSIQTFASRRKKNAADSGTASPENPVWNVSSCVENIAAAEGAALKSPEVASQAAGLRLVVQEFITANTSHDELLAARRLAEPRKSWRGWAPFIAVCAVLGFYHAFSRTPLPPQPTDVAATEEPEKKPGLAYALAWPHEELGPSGDADQYTPTHDQADSSALPSENREQLASEFRHYALPRGIKIDLPKDWWLLKPDLIKALDKKSAAGISLPDGETATLIAANSLPTSTYAAVRINSKTPPSMTPAEVAGITPDLAARMGNEMEQMLQKNLPAQGNRLVTFIGTRVEHLSGFPVLVTEYRRTGRAGNVWVQINEVYTPKQEVSINLSYRESEADRWKSVIGEIRRSIAVSPGG